MSMADTIPFPGAPRGADARTRLAHHVAAWECCVVLVLLAVSAAIGRGPWDPDELKYAQVVQGMRAGSSLFVPHLWGEVYTEKPPLFFWLVLASARMLGGVGLPALLTPTVLAACAGVWMVWWIASRGAGLRAGMLAAVVLVSLPLYLLAAQIGRMDMLLTAFITAAIWLFHRGYADQVRVARVAAFAVMGLAVLSKGAFGIIFPLAIGVTFLAASRQLARLWCRDTLAGIAAFAAVVAVWLVPGVLIQGPDYFFKLIGRQTIDRAVSGIDHGEPAYFYLLVLPALLFPWILFLTPAVRSAWRHWKEEAEETELWLLCWTAVPLVILSLVREKLPIYLMPMMPPVAILIGRHWSEILADPHRDRRTLARAVVLFLIACVVGVGLVVGSLLVRADKTEAGQLAVGGLLLGALGLIGCLLSRGDCLRSRVHAFAMLALMAPCGTLYMALVVMPPLDGARSWRDVARLMDAVRTPGEPVATYQLRPYLGYYVHQQVTNFQEPDEIAELVERRGSVWCAVRPEHIEELEDCFALDRVGGRAIGSPKGPVEVVRLHPLALARRNVR